MNRLEDRLRDAFKADADTVRPEAIRSAPMRPARSAHGRWRSRRARILVPLTAATAVIAVVTGVSLAVPLVHTPSQPAGPPTPGMHSPGPFPFPTGEPPVNNGPLPLPVLGHDGQSASKGVPSSGPTQGVPQYYVTVNIVPGAPPLNSLVVRATATGAVVGTIDPPAGTSFTAIAATAGDRTFITALSPTSSSCVVETQIDQFQLDDQGVPGPLTPLNISIPANNVEPGTLSITPDGSTIAYATSLCTRTQVGVIDLATGHVATWLGPSFDQNTMGLSLSPDGSLLAYETESYLGGNTVAILRTSAPGGSAVARSQVVSRTAAWAALGDNGTALYTCTANPSATVGYGMQALAGGSQRVIASWRDLPYPQCWASMDPSGGYLLVQYPVSVKGASDWVQPAVLNLRTGQLRLITAPAYYGPADVAW